MPLFGHLNDSLFLIFSRENRQLYAHIVSAIYKNYFGTSFLQTVLRTNLIDFIAAELHAHPDLWATEETLENLPPPPQRRGRRKRVRQHRSQYEGKIAAQSGHVYTQLLKRGWIEEEPYGFNTRVEMPPAPMVLAERLVAIEAGLSTMFGGFIVSIRNDLSAIKRETGGNASLGLPKSSETATQFARNLRMIHSSLRSVEKSILGAENLDDRIRTFFEDFIERLLIQDFKTILTSNHPFRFKIEIVELAHSILDDDLIQREVTNAYVTHGVANDKDDAYRLYAQHLQNIIVVFDEIDAYFDELQRFQRRLEQRLSNTIKYMERSDTSVISSLLQSIQKLNDLEELSARSGKSFDLPPTLVQPTLRHISAEGLYEPPTPKKPIAPQTLNRTTPDPAIALYRELMREFEGLFRISPEKVKRYLEQQVPPGGQKEARYLSINSLEDFLAFEEARRYRYLMPEEVAPDFDITKTDGVHDSLWIRCPNFLIYRKTDNVTVAQKGL